jgi:hypothetical protein
MFRVMASRTKWQKVVNRIVGGRVVSTLSIYMVDKHCLAPTMGTLAVVFGVYLLSSVAIILSLKESERSFPCQFPNAFGVVFLKLFPFRQYLIGILFSPVFLILSALYGVSHV